MTQVQEPIEVEVGIHKPSMIKQVMESRSHALDMVREALSNMTTPEVGAENVVVQHYSDPDFGATFRFKDDGCGMEYTGNGDEPGRLDRFVGLGYSGAAGLDADLYSWKGLGAKLMLNCRRLEVSTWTGYKGSPTYRLEVNEPRSQFLQDVPKMPKFYLSKRMPESTEWKGTIITVYGYDGGNKEYGFDEMKRYMYLNSVVGITKKRENMPRISLKVGSNEEDLEVGYQWIKVQHDGKGDKSWRTVVIDPPIMVTESSSTGESIEVVLKGGFTLDTGIFGLSSHRRNTGLRLSVKGIPYFQLDLYAYKGSKFKQYKDLCSFIVECDPLESKLNMDRSGISNQFGDDPAIRAFRRAVAKAFDAFAETNDVQDFFERQKREDEKTKAADLIKRQNELTSPTQEYVCLDISQDDPKILHRMPKNEQDVLAIFWKLEGAGLHPFEKFISFEHTSKKGIDVIANYQEYEDSQLEIMELVEFELVYENFIKHGHNPKQTSAIICWEVQKPNKLKQINTYTYHATIADTVISVYEIKKFPDICIRTYDEIQ